MPVPVSYFQGTDMKIGKIQGQELSREVTPSRAPPPSQGNDNIIAIQLHGVGSTDPDSLGCSDLIFTTVL